LLPSNEALDLNAWWERETNVHNRRIRRPAGSVKFERGLISDTEDFEVVACLYKIFDAVEAIILNFESAIAANPDWLPSPP
jgi:hypothetical protein